MPTLLRVGPYRMFFYSSDHSEPVQVHVERDDNVAKFWLEPIRLHNSDGFSSVELRRIQSIVNDHRNLLIEAWHEYFSK
ncbi:MAG: DUF4160 domain-containing protein [Gammaproteobacteria bacterium]